MQLRRHEKPKPTHPRKKVLVVLLMMFAVCAEVGSQHPVFSSSESGSGLSKITLEPNATSIKVEWTMHDPITTVRYFQVTLKEDDFIRERTYIDSNGPLTTDLFDLVPCFHYTITIQPRDAEGNLVGKSKHQSTITLSATPSAVTGLISQNVSSERLVLSWERPATACEITAYNITCSGVAKWGPRTEHTDSATIGRGDANSTTTIDINDLQPYTDYTVTVAASTDKGVGEMSSIGITTKQTAPSKPINLEMLRSTASTVSMIWKEPEQLKGELKNYKVSCYDGENVFLFAEKTNHPVHIIGGLSACSKYTVHVAAATAGGRGNATQVQVTTEDDVPPPVTELETESITARSLTLSWERPATACEITAYNITYSGIAKWGPRTEPTGSATIGRSDADTTTSIAIGDLQPYTDYVMTVTASTDTGEGKQAEIRTITSKEDVLTASSAKDPKLSEPPSNTAPARVIKDSVTMIVSVLLAWMFNLRFENPAQLMFGTPWR